MHVSRMSERTVGSEKMRERLLEGVKWGLAVCGSVHSVGG